MSKTTKTVLVVLAVLAGLGCLCSGGCMALGLAGAGAVGGADDALHEPTIALTGSRTSWGGYSLLAPPGMSPAIGPDGLQLKQAGLPSGTCSIVLLPQEAASGAPDAQALAIVGRYFAGTATGFRGQYTGPDPYSGQERGTSARGFEWVELPELWPTGENGQMLDARVRIMLVLLGAKVAPIVGLETGEAHCLMSGRDSPHQWLRLFYSLEFPEAGLSPADPAAQVVGRWSLASSSAAVSREYRADGTALFAAGARTTVEISNTRVRETDRTFARDGTWRVSGDRLVVSSDARPAETRWFRVVKVRNTSAQSGWLTELRDFDLGSDGKPYESGLRKSE